MKVTYYLNFAEDNRLSMNEYAQRIINHQKKKNEFIIEKFKPKLDSISERIYSPKWKMRYARYISYKKQVTNINYHEVSHICDHQYAHLYKNLNSKVKFITVHDLIPLVFNKTRGNPLLLKFSLKQLKHFTKVFTVSNNTKKDIIKFTDCPENKIEVISESIEEYFKKYDLNKKNICKKYKIKFNKKKILISGNIFYKNIVTAYKVLENLIEIDKDIIFIHIGNSNSNMIVPNKIKKNVFNLPFIEREKLPSIYNIVDILFFPSIYEGFGLPLLEAMRCGAPIVCSNNSSIPEVVGEAALMSDCYDVFKFTKNITEILNNKVLRNKMSDKSLTRSKIFDQSKILKKINNIYIKEVYPQTA